MGWCIHADTIIMVRTTECMISTIYVVVNIKKYQIKLSLTNDVIDVAIAVSVGVSCDINVKGLNMWWKRAVGWGCRLVHPRGHYHHGSDHRMHDQHDLSSSKYKKYQIKLSLTNDVVGVAFAVGVGGVIVGGVIVGSGSALATAVDISTCATIAADDDNDVSAVVPPSLTNGKEVYVNASVTFKGLSEIASCASCTSMAS